MANGKHTELTAGPLPDSIRRTQRLALIGGAVALALCVLGGLAHPRPFFQAYLIGYMLVLGATLGSMAILMLHHLTGGRWGVPIRRILEAITRTLPVVTLLFVPILFGIHHLYEWSHPEVVAHDELLRHKSAYLNPTFFTVRAAIFFAAWNLFAFLLNRGSVQLERTRSIAVASRTALFSGPGILIYVFTMSFAAFDWLMSLEPHWYSTIYGMHLVVGQVLSALAVVTIILARLAPHRPISEVVNAGHFHDLGNLTLAFVMLWAYMSLSQFLIIWSGNISEEVPWYVTRTKNGWGVVAVLLILLHFALPFVLLLSRGTKRNYRLLSSLAILIVVMRGIDLFWWIAPALAGASEHGELADPGHRPFTLSYMDLLAPVGLMAIWLAVVVWQLGRRSLLPIVSPEEGHENLAGQHA